MSVGHLLASTAWSYLRFLPSLGERDLPFCSQESKNGQATLTPGKYRASSSQHLLALLLLDPSKCLEREKTGLHGYIFPLVRSALSVAGEKEGHPVRE